MDWILRTALVLFFLLVAYLLVLAAIHEVFLYRQHKNASDFLERKARGDEQRVSSMLWPTSEREVSATPRKRP